MKKKHKRSELIKARDKELLRLVRESDRLQEVRRDAPIIKLETPYQRGWKRRFVLREDARARADAPLLQHLLKHIDNVDYCRQKDFSTKEGKLHRRQRRKHHLNGISAQTYHNVLNEQERKYFEPRCHARKELCTRQNKGVDFVFKYPYFYESLFEPHIITHEAVCFPEIEKRIDEVDKQFEALGGWHRLARLRGYSINEPGECDTPGDVERFLKKKFPESGS